MSFTKKEQGGLFSKRTANIAYEKKEQGGLFDKKNSPLKDVEENETGDIEKDLSTLCEAFTDKSANDWSDKNKKRHKLLNDTVDDRFWFCVLFDCNDQMAAFFKAVSADYDKYIDGVKLAERLGIALPERETKFRPQGRIDKDYALIAKPLPVVDNND